MIVKHFLYKSIYPKMGYLFIKVLSSTIRIQTYGEERINDLRKMNQRIVFIFWHGRQFLLVQHQANKGICIMSSTSRDGRLQAKILSQFNYKIAFGSSGKSPVRALVGAIQKMREGFDLAMTVDGPRGPIYKVKPGALFLAKKMGTVIVPVVTTAYPFIQLKSWDKYILPLPFAKGIVCFGEPLMLSEDMSEKTIQKESENLEGKLNAMMEDVDKQIGL